VSWKYWWDILQFFSHVDSQDDSYQKLWKFVYNFVKVTAKILSVPFFGHGVYTLCPQTKPANLPAGLREAQTCRYCFYSVVQKWGFRPAGATRCPDKREIWHGSPWQISRLSGQKCGNTAPKTVKISNFGHKFAPRVTRLHNFYEILSFCTRL